MKPTYEELEEKLKKIENKINVDALLDTAEYSVTLEGEIVNQDNKEIGICLEQFENFTYAFSETAPDWKTRCYRMGNAFGFDFGDPDWLIPDQRRKLEIAENRLQAFQEVLLDVDKYINIGLKSYIRTCSSGGMPSEIGDNILVHFESAADFGYFKNTIAQAVHERIKSEFHYE
jgi:hypothetical protein